MAVRYCVLLFVLGCVDAELCPKQCDCDSDNGLNRATCVDQNIISIEMGVPKGVQVYVLSHNAITELDNFCFKAIGYTSLQALDLSYNLIFWIGLHAFSGLDNLVHLDLSNNRLRYIPSDLFWDTPLLDSLDLSGNIFEDIKNEPLIMHQKLQILNLNGCRIKSLPDRLFNRLPNLKKLDLSENYVMSLSLDVLRPLRKLNRLEFRNDNIKCTPDFVAVETWIVSREITYTKQCKKKMAKMSEKMVSVVVEKEAVDVNDVWNITEAKTTLPPELPEKPLTSFEKFDEDFSAFQAFIIGLELGLAIGVVGTYIWLRKFCKCGQLVCTRPERRRQGRRTRRTEGSDMRANLLWSTVINPELETPPPLRRELSLPERVAVFPPYGLPAAREAALRPDAVRLPDRAETPPPPYHECRINI
ncbi:SLIT and NTRK-like protein 2 isoform X1 [Amyelois transitella]|uniref:SLIT and NTRK-like protein 2 isoform X1 n=1 Tax=Amyelois transitella TaxID=680683 RepID=UPI0029903C7F|nr:SLIT and NTRK-like protein 2 isoform X1 [Amyelois transitella]